MLTMIKPVKKNKTDFPKKLVFSVFTSCFLSSFLQTLKLKYKETDKNDENCEKIHYFKLLNTQYTIKYFSK